MLVMEKGCLGDKNATFFFFGGGGGSYIERFRGKGFVRDSLKRQSVSTFLALIVVPVQY